MLPQEPFGTNTSNKSWYCPRESEEPLIKFWTDIWLNCPLNNLSPARNKRAGVFITPLACHPEPGECTPSLTPLFVGEDIILPPALKSGIDTRTLSRSHNVREDDILPYKSTVHIEKNRPEGRFFLYYCSFSFATTSISLILFSWLTRVAPGSYSISTTLRRSSMRRTLLIMPFAATWQGRQPNGCTITIFS